MRYPDAPLATESTVPDCRADSGETQGLVPSTGANGVEMSNEIDKRLPVTGGVFRPEAHELTTRYITRNNSYAFFEAATHHERLLESPRTWACQLTGLWVMGAVETARGGDVDIVLNEMFCDNSINERHHITGMPIFTATPMAETPVLLTTSLVVQDAGTTPSTVLDGFSLDDILQGRVSTRPAMGTVKVLDVRVRVFAWQLNGQPASNVEFAWTCLAEGVITTRA
jgi:hypothetical protein